MNDSAESGPTAVLRHEREALLLLRLRLFGVEDEDLVVHPRDVLLFLALLGRVFHHLALVWLLLVLGFRLLQRLFLLRNELVADRRELIVRYFAECGEFDAVWVSEADLGACLWFPPAGRTPGRLWCSRTLACTRGQQPWRWGRLASFF